MTALAGADRAPLQMRRSGILVPAAIACALAVRIFVWAFTGRRFEDGLITVTHAVNAANGLGLVHHQGEGHVFGFTSPLSALIPLVGELIHSGGGVLALRLVSLVAAAATVWLADRFGRSLGLELAGRVLVAGYLAFDYLQVLFGMAGMETQIAVAIVLLGAVAVAERRYAATGVALGLALLVRPDFVLWIAPALCVLAAERGPRRDALRAGAIAAAVALPWLVFATIYYGSPVPHTITAKSAAYTHLSAIGDGPGAWLSALGDHLGQQVHQIAALSPFAENYFIDAGAWTLVGWVVVALAAVGAWTRRRRRAAWAPLAFVALFFTYLVLATPLLYFRWYLPPVLALIVVFAGAGLDALLRRRPRVAVAVAAVLVALFALQVPVLFPMERTIQHRIEERVREPLGKTSRSSSGRGRTFSRSQRATSATTARSGSTTIRA